MVADADDLSPSIDDIINDETIPWESLRDATFLITGATGLIGAHIVRALIALRGRRDSALKLLLPVRDPAKVPELFGEHPFIEVFPWHAAQPLPTDWTPDYIIHGASPTASRYFVEHPVETITTIIDGTRAALELARHHPIRGFVHLSTMEVYGQATGSVDESSPGTLDSLSVRSSYPEAKRLAETLCIAMADEYGVPVVIARLAQTFGAGVAPDESRVFAHLARGVVQRKPLTLATDGSKRTMYVSTDDAVRAILILLVTGAPGYAYNVANEATHCSVREMAELVQRHFGDASLGVRTGVGEDAGGRLYPPAGDLRLDTSRLRRLGWTPHDDLPAMYEAMLSEWSSGACSPSSASRPR